MKLSHLTDKALLEDTKNLVKEERVLTTRLLHHLREIDRRRIYSDLRYPSMYEYMVKGLGYSEGAAMRRIQAARLLNQIPALESKLEEGKLKLSQISEANKFFKAQNVREPAKKQELLNMVEGLSTRETDKVFQKLAGKSLLPTAVYLSVEVMEKVDRLKAINGSGLSNEKTIEFAVDTSIKKLEKMRFKVAESRLPPAPAKLCVKSVPAEVKRKVYERDNKQCVKCGSTYNLQFDHRIPKALGGDHSEKNLRLLCFNCNQRSRQVAQLHAFQGQRARTPRGR